MRLPAASAVHRSRLLILDGKSYDSRAILGVAYQLATGRQLGSGDFSGGVQVAAGVLRAWTEQMIAPVTRFSAGGNSMPSAM
jgi:hypothetical protein